MCLGALLAGIPGCNKILGIDNFELTPDAPPDAPGPDAQLCWGAGLAPVCLTSPAAGVKTLDAALNTDMLGTCSDIIAQPSGPDLCVIAATQINVSNTVSATGTRPLMLIATDTISVGGTLDVSSSRTLAKVGAGADFATCGTGTAAVADTTGPGGGAGGTFGTKGSNGGDGRNSLGTVVNDNGVSPAVLALTFVRGGCKGQNGAAAGASAGGVGGASGGAVYLFAATSITVDGNIYANGAGATGGKGGGAGGGAGGLIGLESPTITVNGAIVANGANGSAGGNGTTVGAVGADPLAGAANYDTQAGAATTPGGSGGLGGTKSHVSTVGGTSATASTGGGGGGGGTGIVWVKGTLTGTMISPTPTLN